MWMRQGGYGAALIGEKSEAHARVTPRAGYPMYWLQFWCNLNVMIKWFSDFMTDKWLVKQNYPTFAPALGIGLIRTHRPRCEEKEIKKKENRIWSKLWIRGIVIFVGGSGTFVVFAWQKQLLTNPRIRPFLCENCPVRMHLAIAAFINTPPLNPDKHPMTIIDSKASAFARCVRSSTWFLESSPQSLTKVLIWPAKDVEYDYCFILTSLLQGKSIISIFVPIFRLKRNNIYR